MKKSKHGGARPGAGAKKLPPEQQRVRLYIDVRQWQVDKLGGKKAAQKLLKQHLEGIIKAGSTPVSRHNLGSKKLPGV